MAYETGTATSETDLLQKLDTFLTTNAALKQTAENWVRVAVENLPATDKTLARTMMVWRAPGASGDDRITIGAVTLQQTATDIFNLYFCGGTHFNSAIPRTADTPFSGLVNNSEQVGIFTDRRAFRYWFVASGRRAIIVTNVNSVYSSAYLGFILPVNSPVEYPYPLVVAGSIDKTVTRYSEGRGVSVAHPADSTFWLLYPEQMWRDFRYKYPSQGRNIFPDNGADTYIKRMLPSWGGDIPLFPVEMRVVNGDERLFFGALDGVYRLPGTGRASEDVVTLSDGRRFIVFQNAANITTADYFAVEMA